MKSLRIFSLVALFTAVSMVAVAQTSTETFKVSGNCGMCKKTIEKAAKEAGANEAAWDKDTKELTVTYKSSTTNPAKIQQKVAAAGYDNVGFKSTLEELNVSDFMTTALIGTAITFSFLLVIISTVAVIPGRKGE